MEMNRPRQTYIMARGRHLVLAVLVFIWLIIYLQRVNVGILLVDKDFLAAMGLTGHSGQQGLIMTLFLIPYALTNVLVSPLGDKIGPRKTMLLGMTIGAACMAAGGLAGGLGALLATRMVLGIGHGIHFPAQSIFIKNWFPPGERGRANSWFAVGGCSGALIAMPLFTFLTVHFSWKSGFFGAAAAGILMTIPLLIGMVTDNPAQNRFIAEKERRLLTTSLAEEDRGNRLTSRDTLAAGKQIARSLYFWLVCTAYTAYLCIWWGLVTWLPQYLVAARGFSLSSMGWAVSLPYAVGAACVVLGGILSDRIGKRSLFGVVAFTGAAASILAGALVNSNTVCALLVAAGVGLDVLFYAPAWALLQSLMPSHLTGTGSGVMNGVSNLVSSLSPFVIGMLIEATGSYLSGMLFLAGIAVTGAVSSILLIKREGQPVG